MHTASTLTARRRPTLRGKSRKGCSPWRSGSSAGIAGKDCKKALFFGLLGHRAFCFPILNKG